MSQIRPRWVYLVEASGVTLAAGLWIVLALRVVRPVALSGRGWMTVVLACAVGYAAADFISGLAHWFCDTFFEEETPLIGPLLIRPFREHHRDPLAMVRHGFLEMNGNTCLAVTPLLGLALALGPDEPRSIASHSALGFTACLFAGLVVTNRLHGWAHDPAPPRVACWLQAVGLALSPQRHAPHHHAPYDRSYCVTHGWLNPLLDRTAFFERAARLGERIGLPRGRRHP